MTVRDIRDEIEIQGNIRYVEYDYERDFYSEIGIAEAMDMRVNYIYNEDGFTVFEVENDFEETEDAE